MATTLEINNINMKTITKVYEVYTIDELSEEAQEKARQKYIEGNDYMFMEDVLNEKLKELLEENNIKYLKYPSKTGLPQVLYSLSYSQGDGACFVGEYEYKNITVYITHSSHYCHINSTIIEAQETNNLGYHIDESEPVYKEVEEFNKIYQSICKELQEEGYSFIEYEDSMETFKGACEANEYTFTKDGIMDNSN